MELRLFYHKYCTKTTRFLISVNNYSVTEGRQIFEIKSNALKMNSSLTDTIPLPHDQCESFLFPQSICTTTTAFLHFFFLASFCWVLTEAWQSYMAVTGKIRTRLIRKRFLCLGWGKHVNIPFCTLVWVTLNTYTMKQQSGTILRLLCV